MKTETENLLEIEHENLLKMKGKIGTAKESLSGEEGQAKELLRQLKETMNCSTIKEAKEQYRELKDELEGMENTFNKKYDKIMEAYPWEL